jgi:hypothetical protein
MELAFMTPSLHAKVSPALMAVTGIPCAWNVCSAS